MALFMMIGGKPKMKEEMNGKMEDEMENEMEGEEMDGEEMEDEDKKYESNAKFEHYRGILAKSFMKKYPSDYDKFMTGLSKLKDSDMVEDYVESSDMDKFLSEGEIKRILGSDFKDYVESVSMVSDNGKIEFGKELLAVPVKKSYSKKTDKGSEDRMFYYEPKSKRVEKMVKKY